MSSKRRTLSHQRREDAHRLLLSVCMIVKDEEANLERCLRSVKPLADEIVVVDTGSSDRTVEIARSYGAKVFYFKWCDDFAAARNAALSHATGRWILQIDADEELASDGPSVIRRAVGLAAPSCWGFYLPEQVFYTRDGNLTHNIAYRLLLFRNHADLCYRYRIHENIEYIGERTAPDFQYVDDVTIYHHGYVLDMAELQEKQGRNQRLLKLAIEEDPDAPFLHFNLGKHYYGTGRLAEAVEPLRRAVALCPNPSASYVVSAYAMLVVALSRSGRGEDVPATVAEAEERVPLLTPDFLCNVGSSYQGLGRLDEALSYYQKAIDAGTVRSAAGSDPATHTWRPRFGMGAISEARGELDRARAYYEQAIQFAPREANLHCRMANVSAKQGKLVEALGHVKRVLQMDVVPEEAYGELWALCENLADAVEEGYVFLPGLSETCSQLIGRIHPLPENGARLSGACARFGQFERGIVAANAVLAHNEDLLARVNRGFCSFSLGRYKEAADDFATAAAMEPDNQHVLTSLAMVQRQLKSAAHQISGGPIRPLSPAQLPVPLLPGAQQSERMEEFNQLLASVVITASNGVDSIWHCLEAIVENTPEDLYEVIIVDNASSDGTADLLKLLDGDVSIITTESRLSPTEARNRAAEGAKGKYLVFLDDNTEPQDGWLENLLDLVESDPAVGVVGAKLLCDDGSLQEACAVVSSDGTLLRYGEGTESGDAEFGVAREADYCSSTALLVRKEAWNQIGGFDHVYDSAGYAAADLCFSVRRSGYRVLYQPSAVVVHHLEPAVGPDQRIGGTNVSAPGWLT